MPGVKLKDAKKEITHINADPEKIAGHKLKCAGIIVIANLPNNSPNQKILSLNADVWAEQDKPFSK